MRYLVTWKVKENELPLCRTTGCFCAGILVIAEFLLFFDSLEKIDPIHYSKNYEK